MKNPTVRLAIRALLAGAAVFITSISAGNGNIGWPILEGAAISAAWAALEAFTPLNSLVGYFKHATATQTATATTGK